jgi:DNA invertase Pin-like site-specific DNA recombinase
MTRRKANGGQRRLSRRITLLSLEERIDTNSAAGELVFHVFGAIAHFERRLIAERPKDGIAAARARGKWPGRQPLTFGRTHVKNLAPLAGLTHLRTLETS